MFSLNGSMKSAASLAEKLRVLNDEARSVTEHVVRRPASFSMRMHHVGFFVSAINPLTIKGDQCPQDEE